MTSIEAQEIEIESQTAPTTGVGTGAQLGAMETIRHGLRHSPELTAGIWVTLTFAVIASLGQVVVPIAVQQTLDRGLSSGTGFVLMAVAVSATAVLITGWASYMMTSRLFVSAETGLATLRIKAFRHIHELPMLTQNTERRGALVSRVTSDVDQISQFLIFGGLIFVVSVGQILIATVVMVVYSWELTVVVWLCFAPLFVTIRWFQRRLSDAYTVVRQTVASLLSAISEPVVGAAVVKSYGVADRTQQRIDEAIVANRTAQARAQMYSVIPFSLGGVSAGLANAGVIVVGIWLGDQTGWWVSEMSTGTVLAFAFLVTLFVGPVQMGTQIITDAQNAVASWRRVIGILDTPADLVDPGAEGRDLPTGPMSVELDHVTFAYPGGMPVLHDVSLAVEPGRRVAVVGETGSGKSTIAKLVTRLMDPSEGRVLLDGIDLREVGNDALRRGVVLVPQEGFLFNDTLLANIAYGRPGIDEAGILQAAQALGLDDWLAGLPLGVQTVAGQRGEALSAGERQLVALLRAHVANPDLLVLDEATSAVDPHLEVRITRALERLMSGRTSMTIAHRLSTAEAADEVIVVDQGRIVQRGPHAELVTQGGVYGRMYASWRAQRSL